MPKMTHWNSPEVVDVAPEKVAVFAGQGWQVVRGSVKDSATTVDEAPKPAKKAAAKKATKKAAAKKA